MEQSLNGKYLFVQSKVNSPQDIFRNKEFTDVTLATNDDKQVEAHRIILSSASLFFRRITNTNPKRDIVIYLPNLNFDELQVLLEYIYIGQIEIEEDFLIKFIDIAKNFELPGFEDENILHEVSLSQEKAYKGDGLTIQKQKIGKCTSGKFSCEQCDFKSTIRRNLNRHRESIHLGIKYQCEECSKEYTSTTELNRHVENIHRGGVYQCDQCNKIFGHPKALRHHVREFHEWI